MRLIHFQQQQETQVKTRNTRYKMSRSKRDSGNSLKQVTAFLSQLRRKLNVQPLEEIERRAIDKALRATHDDKVLAAALLGIGKTTLYRKLKKH
jgi:transcriptional regulator with PAS, ATPase and Fis domain